MDAIEMLKEKNRLTNNCKISCKDCKLSASKTGTDCDWLTVKHPEQYVEIIEQWSKDYPKKTYLSDFLEKYPNALKGYDIPTICPSDLGLKNAKYCGLGDSCTDCWNQEIS